MATKSEIQAADYRAEAITRPFADAAERSVPVSKTGDGQSGMRTERVTLEVTGAPGWKVNVTGVDVESVRVVGDAVGSVDARAYADRMGCDEERDFANRILAERDAAIRERDEAKARVAELEAAAKLASRANADGEANHAAQAASGGGEQPRGGLTGEERRVLSEAADVLDDRNSHAYGRFVRDLLARSLPPGPEGKA